MASEFDWCKHCTIDPPQPRGKYCRSCRDYKRRHGTYPPNEWVNDKLTRRWAQAGGSDRAQSVKAIPIGDPNLIATILDARESTVRKRKTSDGNTTAG